MKSIKASARSFKLFALALTFALPACGSSPADDDSEDGSEGALEQSAGKYKLKDYTMAVSRVAVNEDAMEVAKQLMTGGAKLSKDETTIYVGITEKDAGLGDSETTIHGLACREGGGSGIAMRCDFYATVKTAGVKEVEAGVTQLTIDGTLGKLLAESFTKAGGNEVAAGNLKCATAGAAKCTMLVASDDVRNLDGWADGTGIAVVERELSFFYP